MHVDWKQVARVGAQIGSAFVPGAVQIEQMAEAAADGKTNAEKAAYALEAAIKTLEAEGQIAGKNYATPRVTAVLRRLNDDSVELLNALAEAHAQ